jgi:hypothetical protein
MQESPLEFPPRVCDAWLASSFEGFLVGYQGAIVRYSHGSFDVMKSPTDEALFAVWGIGRRTVYAVGMSGRVVFFNGREWHLQTVPVHPDSTPGLLDIWGSRKDNIFVVGGYGTILHFDGFEWRKMKSGTDVTLRGVWGSASDNVYAVGDQGTLLNYKNGKWTALSSGTSANLHAIGGTGEADVIVAGQNVILRFNGQTWINESYDGTLYYLNSDSRYGVFGSGHPGHVILFEDQSYRMLLQSSGCNNTASWAVENSLFVAGGFNVGRFLEGEWTSYKNIFTGILSDIWGVESGAVFACGSASYVLRYNITEWDRLDIKANRPILRSIWGTSSSNVFFAGSEVVSYRTVGIMLHFDGYSFSRMDAFEKKYYGVWGTSENDAIAVGENGLIVRFDGTNWIRMESETTDDLWCVWGDAPDRYFAGSRQGRVYAYDGESWQQLGLQVRGTIYDLWGDEGKIYASTTADGVYCLEDGKWSSLKVPQGFSYYSARSHKKAGLYLIGSYALVLFSPNK